MALPPSQPIRPPRRHSIRLRPDRHGGRGVDRHRRHGRRRHLLDPRRGRAGGRQRHVARLCHRRRGGAAVDLFLRQAGRSLPFRRRRRALPGQELWRRRAGGRPQSVHVGRLHHLAGALRHGLRQLRRDLHHHDAFGAAAQIAGGRLGSAADAGECVRRQNHGARRNAHRRRQGGDPGAVRGHGLVVHRAGESLARALAGNSVDPVRRRRAVHRLRGLRARDQRRRRHEEPANGCCRARSTPA